MKRCMVLLLAGAALHAAAQSNILSDRPGYYLNAEEEKQ